MATLNLNITGGSSPYTISVKKTGDATERFQSFTSGVVTFTSDYGNNEYTITVSKSGCTQALDIFTLNCVAPTPIPVPVVVPTPIPVPTTSPTPIPVSPTPIPVSPTPIPVIVPTPVPVSIGCTSYDISGGTSGSVWQFKYCGSTEVTTLTLGAGVSNTNICVENSYGMNKTSGNGISGNNGACTESPTPIPLPVPIPIPIPVAPTPVPVSPTPIPIPLPVSTCVNLTVTNNELVANIITFTLCSGSEQSYTLAAGQSSPTVCALNADAWLSNLPGVTVVVGSAC